MITKKMLLGLSEEKQRAIINDYIQTNLYEEYLYEMNKLPEIFGTVTNLMKAINKNDFDFSCKYFYCDDFGRIHMTDDLYESIDARDIVDWINEKGDDLK